MQIDRFTIHRAPAFNNGKPGGKEYWIVFLHGDERKPTLFETLDAACKWITELATSLSDDHVEKLRKAYEETWQHNYPPAKEGE